MEIENWSDSSSDSMELKVEPPQNPIYQITHEPAIVRNPHTGRYISTTARAYNELTRGVYRTPADKKQVREEVAEPKSKTTNMDDLWARHGF
jgi:hypothetical protein